MKDGRLIFNGTHEDIGENLEEFYLEQFDDNNFKPSEQTSQNLPANDRIKRGGVITMYNLRALIKYEYKKLLQRKAVWIVTLTLMAMAAASVILPPFMTVISSNNDNGIPYYAGTAAQLYDLRKDYLQARRAQESLSDEEKAFLTAQEEDITTPFIYRYCGSYKSILATFTILSVMVSFLTAVCIPPVSAEEHSRKTDQIILCTRFGRRPAFLAKLFTAVIFSVAAALLLFISFAVPSFVIYGTEGFSAQIQFHILDCTWKLTIGQSVLILFGISIAAAIMLGCAALYLAEHFRSSIPAMGVLIGFLLISSFFNIPGQFRVLSQIWSYCPAKLISVAGGLIDHRLVPFFGTYLASYQVGPFIYLILALLFAFGGYFVWRRWQAGGR